MSILTSTEALLSVQLEVNLIQKLLWRAHKSQANTQLARGYVRVQQKVGFFTEELT